MKKKLLWGLSTLCLMLILASMSTREASASSTVVTNTTTSTDYTTLADSVADAASEQVLQIQNDITLPGSLTLSNSITLDLNGHTITGPGTINISGGIVQCAGTIFAISNESTGVITISGTAQIKNNSNLYPAISLRSSSLNTNILVVNGGTISNLGTGDTINSQASGIIEINGGTITGNRAIGYATINITNGNNYNTPVLRITGGTVESGSAYGNAISHNGIGTMYISGGTVTKSSQGTTIMNNSVGVINISGTATVQNMNSNIGDYMLLNKGSINISGGTH